MGSSSPRALLAALLVALGLAAPPVLADDPGEAQAREALDRMVEALHHASFEGTFVYARAGIVETVRIRQGVRDDGRYQRLELLSGEPREIIQTPERIAFSSERAEGRPLGHPGFRRTLGDGWPRAHELPEDRYRIRLAGAGRIADRPAEILLIEPLDQLRYGHRLWLDEETGLPLQAQLLDGRRVIERLLFTHIAPREHVDRAELEPRHDAGWHAERVPTDEQDGDPRLEWHVPDPPPGFRLSAQRRIPGDADEGAIAHMLFSDGLATVSVYVQEGGDAPVGRARAGALQAFERPVNDHHVTAIGDVPAETVERFASGTQPR